ncbi:MAG: hypothetical protein ABIP53_01440 [Candidatus Limnocylindrales bacterium]
MRNWLRMATAVAVLVGGAFLAPQSVFACSGPALTLEEATSTATLILAGRVVSNPHEWAYELEVEETFHGPSSDTFVIGPVAPDHATDLLSSARGWRAGCSGPS